MLGQSATRSLHRRRPASSSSFHPVRRSVLARSVFASRPGRRRRVPTGDGRLLSPSRLRRRAARTNGPGHAVLQIRRICLYLPYRKGRQNCINSVGHFYFVKSDAAKQLPTSPGASPGPLGDSGKIRVPRLRRPNLFLLLRPKGWPFGNPRLLRNTPGPHPGFFVWPEKQNTHHQP